MKKIIVAFVFMTLSVLTACSPSSEFEEMNISSAFVYEEKDTSQMSEFEFKSHIFTLLDEVLMTKEIATAVIASPHVLNEQKSLSEGYLSFFENFMINIGLILKQKLTQDFLISMSLEIKKAHYISIYYLFLLDEMEKSAKG